ncbi:ice-binding family protein [Maribacter sp. ACAM166]|uniref:ice-binding family protein n=1 Tax=Maribacter sp. ACAM166 TaxID=2508996 RepID=UPI0010FE2C68|nr:ice-binding family protein [Maribacter sp. ACAM166]TLP75648.1 DUF3494 domain-containing protein [Maribacter sp. ACAM166]
MNKKLLFNLTTIALVSFSSISFSQTFELGTLSSFETYTGSGAITNEGEVTGDAGTNAGIISGSGFDAANGYTGTIYNNEPKTVEARIDLLRVYIHLSDVFVTHPTGAVNAHTPAFGGGETITSGVYSIGGAGSIGGALTLDGGGDSNAYFIIKFEGALTVGVGSTITLTGGTRAANVFWIAEGAISVGANSALKGTLFSHNGAVSLGANCTIDGRILATEGAITIGAGSVAATPAGDSTIPIKCLGFCSPNPLVDVLGSVGSYALFTSDGALANAATSGVVGDIGTNKGAISGFSTSTHVGFFNTPNADTAQAALDLDSAYNQLMDLPNTPGLSHTPAFGAGETVFPGVYSIGGAGSLAGTITLDAMGDPNAIFVFKYAGAFTVAAQSKVIFTNGTRRCNVFWIGGAGIASGAVSIGTFTYMKGTVISHGGAATMEANGNLEGRLLSTGGAIGFSTGVVYNDTLCFEPIQVTGSNQEGCFDDVQTLTATATTNITSQNIVWYDAPTGGNVIDSPTQEGIGAVTYYGEAFNGAYASEARAAVTLTIKDCPFIIVLDDDYDGMTNEEEYCTTSNATFLVSQDVGARLVVVTHTDTGYLRLDFSSMDNSFQLDINGTTVHPSVLEFENGALGAGEEYFVFQSDNTFISSPWVANTNGLPRLRLIVDELGKITFYGTRASTSTSLEIIQAQASTPFNTINWIPGSNNSFTITNQSGPGPEGFTGVLFASALCDSDGDGVINSLDLDSDNDGIYDIVESGVLDVSGVNDVDNDGIIDGVASDFGNNGLHSNIEDNDMANANLTYTIADSDVDGIYDAFEIDADNDACNDVLEAGYSDTNNDGILAALSTVVNSNGLVTGSSVIDGYTTPDDNDSNSTYDFQEASSLPTITLQPMNSVICPGCSSTFSVTPADATSYQWQIFNGTSWLDLTNTGIHSTTTTDALSITNATSADNDNQYRVVLAKNNYVCGTTISNTATLTIRGNTVITNRRRTYRVKKN